MTYMSKIQAYIITYFYNKLFALYLIQIGEYIDFDINNNSLICTKCDIGTYSNGGNLLIKGYYKEWNDIIIKQFKTNCYLSTQTKILTNTDCASWTVNKDNTALVSGKSDIKNVKYYSELVIVFKLINSGKVFINFK